MMTPLELREALKEKVAKWRPVLGLNDWKIGVKFNERQHMATCTADPEYEQATLHFNVRRIRAEVPANQLDELVVHELTHCLTWVVGDALPDDDKTAREKADELLTTRVERSVIRAYQLGLRDASV